ncbi:MAG: hypothetical protein ABIP95_11010 [Pelobium sp.]
MFHKLNFDFPNSYTVNSAKNFLGAIHLQSNFDEVFNFAYAMTFGKIGFHRAHRSGGLHQRKNGELFINTFQGKMAEFGIYEFLKSNDIEIDKPDLSVLGEGIWDESDFTINGKKISIKSTAFFSNLLLLETKDWDLKGNYLPDLEKGNAQIDYFILARIKPNSKGIMIENKLFYTDEVDENLLKKIMRNQLWVMDIPGYVSLDDLKGIIKNKYIIPQNSFLNGKIKMDAANYYFQTGDLRRIEGLVRDLTS